MDLKFGDVQETALIPLAIKASETARADARIKDEVAKKIIDTLGVDVSKFDGFMSHEGVIARTILFRDKLKELIAKYPDAQVDNGKITWFDVDLADQIAVRRKVFEDSERCKMLDGDALDGFWTEQIPKDRQIIVILEGVMEYFSKEQVKTCLNMLCTSFKEGILLVELHSKWLEEHYDKHDTIKHTNAKIGWGTESGKDYEELDSRYKLLSEISYNEEMKKYTLRGKLFAIVGKNVNNRLAVFKWKA